MTIKDMIKLIPVDEDLKTDILENFDQMSENKQLAISRIAWKYYYSTFGQNLEKNLEEQFQDVINGEEHFDKEYYERAVKKTDQDLTKVAAESSTQTDLATVRKAVDEIVEENGDNKTKTQQP